MKIDFIPATEWQCAPHDAETIRIATESGTANFEQAARNNGSSLYTCRYNEIGRPCSDTSAVKDGRPIITEQNLSYFPVWIRFYYEQPSSAEVYRHLEEGVLPHLNSHQVDLTKFHREKIEVYNNSAPFVYAYSPDSGTDLLHLMPTIEETDPKIWLGKDNWRHIVRWDMLDYHTSHVTNVVRLHKNFLHFDGNKFHTCTGQQIRDIYLEHIEKILQNYVKKTQIFLVKSSAENTMC